MTTLRTTSDALVTTDADAVVVAVAPGGVGGHARVLGDQALPAALRDALVGPALTGLGITGARDQVRRVATLGTLRAPVLVLVGVGELPASPEGAEAAQPAPDALRRAAGAASRELAGTASAVLALPASSADAVAAVAEGALLGAYAYTSQKSAPSVRSTPVASLHLRTTVKVDAALKARLERARVLAAAVAGVRDLVNAPPNELYPQTFAEAVVAAAAGTGVEVSVLDEQALAAGGYGGILGVGQGSPRPPRLVRVAWSPRRASRHLALVGKGITFDSGGLSLKPGPSMVTMKCDMAGAATVLHVVLAAARLRLPVRVTGWLALAENMPSGSAQRPSDVLTTYGGTTVEVLNTDAEGRLVMADAIVAAGEESPDAIVDIATLTGAQVLALGHRTGAVMGDDEVLRARVLAAAAGAGEPFWAMPLPEELRASLDSPTADLANIGERMGGMQVAGLFLREFVPRPGGKGSPRLPWAHLDVAGPAYNEGSPHGYTPKGATGMGAATLLGLAEDFAR